MPQGQKYVQTPDGAYHAFPSDATDDQISEALNSHLTQRPDPSFIQKLIAMANVAGSTMQGAPTVQKELDMLPAAGGAVGGAIGGAGGTAFGLGVGGVPGAVGGAAVGGGAGEAAKQLISRGLGLQAPASPGEAAKGIAKEGAIQGATEAVGAPVGMAMKAAAPRLMQSAVKPALSLAREYRTTAPQIVQTLLDEGVNVTKGGLAKLNQIFGDINTQIADKVANIPGTISKKNIAAEVLPTAHSLAGQANPNAALKDVGNSVDEFLNNHPMYPGNDMLPPEVQRMKMKTYQNLGDSYGQLSSATNEAQKALARGGKNELAAMAPEISDLNARDSKIMAAREAVGHRVAVAGNANPMGLATLTHGPVGFLSTLMDRSPAVKSMLANGMWQGAAAAAGVSPQLIRAAVLALATEGKGGG